MIFLAAREAALAADLIKIFGGLVPGFVSLSRKLRFWSSDAAFSRQFQHSDTKIESDRKSFWSPEKGPVEIATDRI